MSKIKKLILKILTAQSDKNIDFNDLKSLLEYFGFHCRIKGGHLIYYKDDIEEIINIQADGSRAKTYQVKQIRELLIKYKLADYEF